MPTSKKSPSSLTILGIDPGYADTGYGVIRIQDRRATYVTCDSIKSSKALAFPQRLLTLGHELDRVILEYRPQLIAIEKIFFFKNKTTVINVAQARGVLLMTAARHGITIVEYTPLEIKMSLTSYGHAPKPQVGLMVKTLLGMKSLPKQDDAVDALAIALCASFRTTIRS